MSLDLARALAELYAPEEQQVARTLDRLFRAGGDREAATRYQRMADFTSAREVLHWQAQLVMSSPKDDRDNWDYLRATALLLKAGWTIWHTYPNRETLAVFEAAYQMACRTGVYADQAQALRGLGRLHGDLSEYELATEALQKALALSQRIDDRLGEATAWSILASIDMDKGENKAARQKYHKALAVSQQIDDRKSEAKVWNNLATIEVNEGEYRAAREKFQMALAIQQQIGDRASEASTWNNLAAIDYEEGEYRAAREKFQKALAMQQEIVDRAGEASAWNNLAVIDYEEGEYRAAREKFQKSLEIKQQLGNRVGEATTFAQLGIMAAERGRVEEGLRLITLSAMLFQSAGHADLTRVEPEVNRLASQLNYTQEQFDALCRQVAAAYQKDRGWGLVKAVFPDAVGKPDPGRRQG